MSTEEVLMRLRKEAEDLKAKIKAARSAVHDTTLSDVARDLAPITDPGLKVRNTFYGHLAIVVSLHWCADSRFLVSASQDAKLLVWDTYTSDKQNAFTMNSPWVMTCGYSPSGNFVACGGLENIVSIYNVREKQGRPRDLGHHTGYVSCVRFLNDQTLLTASGDHTCALWDLNTGAVKTQFQGHENDVMFVDIHPSNDNVFVSGSCDQSVKLWDVRTGKNTQTLTGNTADVNCAIFFSKSGRVMFACDEADAIAVHDTLKGNFIGYLEGHRSHPTCLGVPKDGGVLASCAWDNTLKLWN
eukprot:Colp12_sorted_trinity150504_noHs@8343